MHRESEASQADMFRSRLDQQIDLRHPLVKLAELIPWDWLDTELSSLIDGGKGPRMATMGVPAEQSSFLEEEGKRHFARQAGKPRKALRLMAGLQYLKHAKGLSDEEVCATWMENPYFQFFTGEVYFQTKLPCDPSSLTRFRQALGEEGVETLLMATIEAVKAGRFAKRQSFDRIIVDTTVQEKAVAHPTDSRLYEKARQQLVDAAKAEGIVLRQSYARIGPKLSRQVGRFAHAKQFKRMRRALRAQKARLGRVHRDMARQLDESASDRTQHLMATVERLLAQKPKDKSKLYALHAPEVECISKGKAHKRYEFGVKASFAITAKDGWVVGARTFAGNPYDGHTLYSQVEQVEILTNVRPKLVLTDKGYRGGQVPDGVVFKHSGHYRNAKRSLRKWLNRRSTIEPHIGHMKADGLLGRNWLKGAIGDIMHSVLCAAGHNIRMLLKRIESLLARILAALQRFLTRRLDDKSHQLLLAG